ncbi:hypothetical protein [Piscirickettsia litoralis]|uniref:Uncharacterized protein n=1 Tax=Piscirickettsia litoralis TaxID=1891921 RepID=A0ABX3A4B4_9GAMM|nr:hypothetical protein [Piscirickettsia litoralis]ODN43449.1 hypothetical protein BGC07_11630 [Piscirickettsia litoralis]
MKKTAIIFSSIASVLICLVVSFLGGGLATFAVSVSSFVHIFEWVIFGVMALFVGIFIILGTIVICAAVWDELFEKIILI